MMKPKSTERSSARKSRRTAKTVDEYLASVPEPARSTLMKVRLAIRSAVPKGTTEILSYGMPAFKNKRVLLWYAEFANHCSLFPTASVIAAFRDDLKGYRTSKGTIQFPVNKPLPVWLVRKLVRARVADVDSNTR